MAHDFTDKTDKHLGNLLAIVTLAVKMMIKDRIAKPKILHLNEFRMAIIAEIESRPKQGIRSY